MLTNRIFLLLQHIPESLRRIEIVTENISYGEYIQDWQKQDTIVRNIEITGEASKQLDVDFKSIYPFVPRKKATGMRNFLIHEYFDVEYDEVWRTLKNDLPEFKSQIEIIINDLEKNI